MTIFEDIVRFVRQSTTTDLKHKDYLKEYMGFEIRHGFGQGTPARVTWISFLGFGQKASEGIYPVLLYYKEQNRLVLSYGVSDTNKSSKSWVFNQDTPPKIEEYFKRESLGKPARYGNSYVFKVYSIDLSTKNCGLDEDTLTSDLDEIIRQYRAVFEEQSGGTMPDNDFFNAITKFVAQANEKNLSTSGYLKQYGDLDVKLSFGDGVQAKVPWMGLLGFGQDVHYGIYPVYLYYKTSKTLILSYLESTPTTPRKWKFKGQTPQTISAYFQSMGIRGKQNWDTNYLHSVYQVDLDKHDYGLDRDKVTKDLEDIMDAYREQFEYTKDNDWIDEFVSDASAANFMINRNLVLRYVASLLAKQFVIFTGLSGSGKTKLALLFAQWICESSHQYRLVPVGADWNNREQLLGYPNALDANSYVKPDSGVLDLLLEASKPGNADKPYFLILDEMNMSHVERYFADFLSAMESGQEIYLHPNTEGIGGVPPTIKLSRNLFIVGTVNIDETTYMFSPKVLDRANVIEFRVRSEEMNEFLSKHSNSAINFESGLGKQYSKLFMDSAQKAYTSDNSSKEILLNFFEELQLIGAEFGYRSAFEINRFSSILKEIGESINDDQIMDYAIMQKLLPKIHGSRRKLEPVLRKLMELCCEDRSELEDLIARKKTLSESDPAIKYHVSFRKLLSMFWSMSDNGFTSYTEA